jgi:hypothetical protein
MITDEPLTAAWFHERPVVKWIVVAAVAGGGLLFGYLYNKRKERRRSEACRRSG